MTPSPLQQRHPLTTHLKNRTNPGPGLLVAALILIGTLCPACNDPKSSDSDALYSVVERGLPWQPLHTSDAEQLTMSWTFDEPAEKGIHPGWTAVGKTTSVHADGTVALTGNGLVSIQGPGLNPEIHHTITMRLRTRNVNEVRVGWRGEGEAFHPARTYKLPIETQTGNEYQTIAIPVSSLRGTRHLLPKKPGDPSTRQRWSKARDAAEGVAELRVGFAGSGPLKVQLDELHVLSNFDNPEIGKQRLGRDGIYMVGSAVRAPDSLVADIVPRPAERLRMWLAVAGAVSPTMVRLRGLESTLPEQTWELQPSDNWVEVTMDLSDRAGESTQIELLTEGGGDTAIVMVGSVLRMAPAEIERPSILLYLVDTLRADRLGTFGYERQTDPHLQSLASQGVIFENTFAASNWTRPATSSLHTSLDSITHGNNSHLSRVSPHFETLAEQLAKNGYLTISFVTNFNASEWAGLEQGMDIWCDPPAYGAVHAADSLTSRLIGPPIREFLEKHGDEQFFLYAHSGDPHVPYEPPADMMKQLAQGPDGPSLQHFGPEVDGNSKRYDAEILFNDNEIRLIDNTLTATGRHDDTVFAFVSDHGEGFGEHGAFEHRELLYQEELHVPLVLRWPGAIPPGQRRSEPVGQIDLAPTLLGLVGGDIPQAWQGRDLSSSLRNGISDPIEQVPILAHVVHSSPREGLHDEIAVIWGSYKLIAGVTPEGELVPRSLHDLASDPGEVRDLLGTPDASSVQKAALDWGTRRVEQSRAASLPSDADKMDPAKRQWMIEMGYL
ncbi:MAG: sulfatase [Planctomycetota bacterium]|nr:sulfatase [Planctomycetota bacterium]